MVDHRTESTFFVVPEGQMHMSSKPRVCFAVTEPVVAHTMRGSNWIQQFAHISICHIAKAPLLSNVSFDWIVKLLLNAKTAKSMNQLWKLVELLRDQAELPERRLQR